MSVDVQKAHKLKRTHPKKEAETWSPAKKHRFKEKDRERFLHFCDIVLAYTQYEPARHDEVRAKNNTSPLDSGGSTAESFTSEANTSPYNGLSMHKHPQLKRVPSEVKTGIKHEGDDSFDLITCFCRKPFGGRPMIECSDCLTWIHLSCAKIRRNNIPDEFTCQNCKENKLTKRKSDRIRPERRKTPSPIP